MAGTRTAASGNATYTFSWTAATARIDEIAYAAARKIRIDQNPDQSPASFDALTLQQKINVLDVWISQHITILASQNKIQTDVETAEATAQQYAAANYGL